METVLEFKEITKVFPGVRALDGVSFRVAKGSVHGLVGENGAGKSTLLKILSGAQPPSSGDLLIKNEKKEFTSTRDAFDAKVAIIYQELNLVPDMTVSENLLLGHFPQKSAFLNKRQMLDMARKQIRDLMEDIDPNTKIKNLPIGQRQMIEIGKALLHNAEIIAFDEPTSSLSEKEVTQLFKIIKNLQEQGKAIIYVSHRMEEIFNICDTVTVFRDGKHIETFTEMSRVSHDILVQRMVGREIKDVYGYRSRQTGEKMFEVKNIRGKGVNKDLSFDVAKGEIVGFFGLVGAGRTELLKLIFGAEEMASGQVFVHGRQVEITNPVSAINNGICLCPEDRKDEGIIPVRSVSENINISSRRHFMKAGIFLDKQKEKENCDDFIDKLDIKTPSRDQLIGNLSGGNQQKTILARWLSEEVDVFLLDEPTRGIDVGAKYEIYQIMYQLAEEGKVVIFVSSDLPEVMGVADRVIVMRDGGMTGSLDRSELSDERILSMALPTA